MAADSQPLEAQAAKGKTPAANTVAAAPDSLERALFAEEEALFVKKLTTMRSAYLKRAAWAELGDRCNPGALRIFPADTSSGQQLSVQRIVESMESTIIARGLGARLDTPEAQALLRTVIGWEAGIDRPRWDTENGEKKYAVAAGLTGETPDPRSDRCLPSPLASDTVTFVIPGAASVDPMKGTKPAAKTYLGMGAIKRARDEFFTAVGSKNPKSELAYVRIAPVLVWRDWALATVNRPRERAGVEIGSGSNGGATYMLRRVEGEWRLLSIVRSWGS
jgi:hypothetical protein